MSTKKQYDTRMPICSKKRYSNELITHKRNVHVEVLELEAFKCENCKFDGDSIKVMKEHVIEKQVNKNTDNKFACTERNFKCGKRLTLLANDKKEHEEQNNDKQSNAGENLNIIYIL